MWLLASITITVDMQRWNHFYWIPIVVGTILVIGTSVFCGMTFRKQFILRNGRPSSQSASMKMNRLDTTSNSASRHGSVNSRNSLSSEQSNDGRTSLNRDLSRGDSLKSGSDSLKSSRESLTSDQLNMPFDRIVYRSLRKEKGVAVKRVDAKREELSNFNEVGGQYYIRRNKLIVEFVNLQEEVKFADSNLNKYKDKYPKKF